MKLIIDIDEQTLEEMNASLFFSARVQDRLADAIANGIPLPKGHGKLIDASVLKDKVASWLKPEKPDETEMISLDNALVSMIIEIEESETIIEADKEDDNE